MVPIKGRGNLVFHDYSPSASPALWTSVAHSRTAVEGPIMGLPKWWLLLHHDRASKMGFVHAALVLLLCLFEESFVVSRHCCGMVRARGVVVHLEL